jgi:osmoprotectant transport system permease protein
MIQQMWELLISDWDFFLVLLIEHVAISLIAIIFAIVIGGFLGIAISEHTKVVGPVLGSVNFLYTIPSISMLGFLIPFSGIGNTTAVIALTIYALLPMVRNTYAGIKNVDPHLIEAAKGMGSTKNQILYKIKIPLAIPYIITGIKSMVVMTIALAGIASFIGAGGLGVAIYRGITTNNAAMTMDGSLLIALLALIFDAFLSLIERILKNKNKSFKGKKTNQKVKDSVTIGLTGALTILIIGGAALTNVSAEGPTIHIATKPMTEQYIMGNMLEIMIEQDTDLNVDVTQGVGGGTSNIQPAMVKGDFDLYPEYTGTAWNLVLNKDSLYTEDNFDSLIEGYDELGFSWKGMYGFNNTYGLVVRSEIADEYNIETYSDLSSISNQLTFGAEYDFYEREDGYDALCDTYSLNFKDTKDLDIGLKYQAIAQEQIDVMNIFTTDGLLSTADVKVLEDNLNFYPSYKCGNVVRNEILISHPELENVLVKFDDLISDANMAQMNYKVEELQEDPENVAIEFLENKGLLISA